MRELALFAGAGGGLLGSLLLGHEIIGACENDRYCRNVLFRRQEDGVLPRFPIWGDVRYFDPSWVDIVDIITAGFPCQPFSLAGKMETSGDERNLWPETVRVIREIRPGIVFLENVPGLLAVPYFGTILGDLASAGYDAEWLVMGANHVGAPHRRDRLWILAYLPDAGRNALRDECWRRSWESWADAPEPADDGSEEHVADTDGGGLEGCGQQESLRFEGAPGDEPDGRGEVRGLPDVEGRERRWWSSEPSVGRLAHGVPRRVDRLRAIGNAQVPLQMAHAFVTLARRALGEK